MLASSLAFVDGSIVNVGLPAIARSLAADGASLSWVISGYLLPSSALLLLGGAAGAGPGAIGPFLGGWLIEVVGWRAMFLVNMPIAAAALAYALLFV